jgi:hypothetical protein
VAVQLPDTDGDCRTCEFCDAHVTPEFRRSYGTADRRALRCPECDSWARIMRGSAAGKIVDHPDPQKHDGRNGGVELRGPKVTDGGLSR